MTVRFYSSIAQQTTLVSSVSPATTVVNVASTTGFPGSTPFTIALDYNAPNEELVDVTSIAGTSLTVTRAVDGTSATVHNPGAAVRHVSSARDFSDSRNHENSDDGIHGLANGSEIVGTDDTQTLNNKTLASGKFTGTSLFQTTNPGDEAINVQAVGDTTPRLKVFGNGTEQWSSGSASPDVSLSRSTASTLQLDGALMVQRTGTGLNGVSTRVAGDANSRFLANSSGNVLMGGGTSAPDVTLARTGTSALTITADTTINGNLVAPKGAVLTGAQSPSTAGVEAHPGPSSLNSLDIWDSSSPVAGFQNGVQGGFPSGTLSVPEIKTTNAVAFKVTTNTALIQWTTQTGLHLPSYGNATMNYLTKVVSGILHFSMVIQFGSSTNFGSSVATGDNWMFSLSPSGVYTAESAFRNNLNCVGHGSIFSNNSNTYPIDVKIDSTGSFVTFDLAGGSVGGIVPTNAGAVDSITPFTWASSNVIRYSGFVPVTPSF